MLLMTKAVSMRKIKQHSIGVEYLRMTVCKIVHRDRERERERERHKRVFLFNRNNNTTQPYKKVTRSLHIVTDLGQLPFMLITQMAQTWSIQKDSVNTSIIHLYSTLPRNGRIHGLSKNTGIGIGSRTYQFCSSRQGPKAEDRTGRVGRVEADH